MLNDNSFKNFAIAAGKSNWENLSLPSFWIKSRLQKHLWVVESTQLASLSTLSVKIVARIRNPLLSQDEST